MDTIFYNLNLYLDNFPMLILGTVFILSLLIGSFLNVVIYRLPISLFNQWRQDCYEFLELKDSADDAINNSPDRKINLFYPQRSFCPNCKVQINFYDNIPVVSFILLKAKCRACSNPISWRYPIIELLTAIASTLVFIQFGFSSLSLAILFLSFLLIIISAIDFDHQIIPDNLSYIGLWLGLLINISFFNNQIITSISDAILGAVLGYLVLWIIYWTFKLLTGKEGFGHGDFKLNALFGAWLGILNLLPILIMASILAIACSVSASIIGKHKLDQPFPFGPFLAFAGWIVLLFQNSLVVNILSV